MCAKARSRDTRGGSCSAVLDRNGWRVWIQDVLHVLKLLLLVLCILHFDECLTNIIFFPFVVT